MANVVRSRELVREFGALLRMLECATEQDLIDLIDDQCDPDSLTIELEDNPGIALTLGMGWGTGGLGSR